jgi:hypothetical protein
VFPTFPFLSIIILLLRSTQASAPKSAMSGYDVKLSGQAPYLPWAKIKGTYYYWDAKLGPDIKGNILGVDIEVHLSPFCGCL